MSTLLHRPSALVLGLLIGATVLLLAWAINERIGVLGGYSNVVERATGRVGALGWKAWFLFGVFAGAGVFRLLAGSDAIPQGYGWLTRELGDRPLLVGAVLLGAGALIGYGAKTAGGCTSGNGLGACSSGSPAGFTATATFMATAIGVSFLIRAVT